MTKTQLTKEIEKALIEKFCSNNLKNYYGALEVPCANWLGKGKQNIDFEDFAKEKIGIHDWISLGTKELTSWNTLKTKPIKTYFYISYRHDLEDKLLIIQQSNQNPNHFRWSISSLLFSAGQMDFSDNVDSPEEFGK